MASDTYSTQQKERNWARSLLVFAHSQEKEFGTPKRFVNEAELITALQK